MPFGTGPILVHIVDDDTSVRKALTRLMDSAGLESRSYDGPESFLAQVRNDARACIVLDITMPRMNGLVLLEQLRVRGIVVPVIAVSARDDEETRQYARSLGVGLFLRKPVDAQALLDAIAWLVDGGVASSPAAAGGA